jgi:hypothetical protein
MVRVASIFGQLLALFPRTEFQNAVNRCRAERYSKGFACWDQFVAMLFCQLAQARSLREICGGLACCLGKLRHLGVTTAPNKSTLAYANEHRPWQLYEEVFGQLLSKCQIVAAQGKRVFRFRNKLYTLDSTVIDLCLSLFDWAQFRQTKGAIKLHLLLDHDGYLPVFGLVTDGRVHDVKVAQKLEFAPGTVLVVDRGYVDYSLFGRWTAKGVWFVTRMKDNAAYEVVEERAVPERGFVVRDEVIRFTGAQAQKNCPHSLRRIEYTAEDGETLVFLTNHKRFAAETVAAVYKDRWQIELFFKALKQNLKIKTFVGTGPNAVRIQIWTALIAMLLLRYLQLKSRIAWSLSNLVALLRWNLFTYRDLWTWLNDPFETPPIVPAEQQLTLDLG